MTAASTRSTASRAKQAAKKNSVMRALASRATIPLAKRSFKASISVVRRVTSRPAGLHRNRRLGAGADAGATGAASRPWPSGLSTGRESSACYRSVRVRMSPPSTEETEERFPGSRRQATDGQAVPRPTDAAGNRHRWQTERIRGFRICKRVGSDRAGERSGHGDPVRSRSRRIRERRYQSRTLPRTSSVLRLARPRWPSGRADCRCAHITSSSSSSTCKRARRA